eukprot:m.75481 g.75481  ORF g.75481 m.75481 type:complete len:938 (+) comp13135_c0_seq2:369-3182(+)
MLWLLVLLVVFAFPAPAHSKGNANLSIIWYDWAPCQALVNVSSHWEGGVVRVKCVPLTAWRPTIMDSLRAHSSEYDIVILDSQWIGEAVFADGEPKPWIVELTDIMNDPAVRKSDFIDAALSAYSIYPPNSKHYWGLPFNGNVMLMLYRKSIFTRLGLITPSTLEEFMTNLDIIKRSGLVPNAFSTFWCGSEDDTVCYDETPTIWNQLAWMFGGQLWDDTTYRFRGILDAPENVAALEFMKAMYNHTSQRPYLSHTGALQEFCHNKSAVMLEWFSFLGRIESLANGCPIADDIGYFPVPGLAQTGLHILQIGGMGLHINAFSSDVAAATDLAKFLISRPMQKLFSSLGGYSVRNSVLAEPDFLFSSAGQCLSYRYIFLQSFPLVRDFWNIPEYQPLLRIQRSLLTQALIGNMTSQEALTAIATQQEAIVLAAHPCGPACPTSMPGDSGLSVTTIFIIAFSLGMLVALVVLVLVVNHLRHRNQYPFPKADRWAVPPACITALNRLGEGAFGVVFLGRYERQTPTQCINKLVACKYIRENPTRDERRTFIKEADTFKHACSVSHPNIVQLIGTCLQGDPMMIIMEYMSNGDVKSWLTTQREEHIAQPPELLMRLARDAAAGMAHLAHIGVVHCDLAARNCMLDDDLVLKITDWGQAHKVTYSEMYQMTIDSRERVLPIRWMAPEALLEGTFSTNTDVWSYGVLLWEIYSHGAMPYHIMTNKEVFEEIVKGYRLLKPADCPDTMYQVMLACWSPNRPSFTQLEAHIRILQDPSQPSPPSLLAQGLARGGKDGRGSGLLGYLTAKGLDGTPRDWHVVGGNDSTRQSPRGASPTGQAPHEPPALTVLYHPTHEASNPIPPPRTPLRAANTGYEQPFPIAYALAHRASLSEPAIAVPPLAKHTPPSLFGESSLNAAPPPAPTASRSTPRLVLAEGSPATEWFI